VPVRAALRVGVFGMSAEGHTRAPIPTCCRPDPAEAGPATPRMHEGPGLRSQIGAIVDVG